MFVAKYIQLYIKTPKSTERFYKIMIDLYTYM